MRELISYLAAEVRRRWQLITSEENRERGGMSAEAVILIAVLVALAIAVGVIITNKVLDKANNINLG